MYALIIYIPYLINDYGQTIEIAYETIDELKANIQEINLTIPNATTIPIQKCEDGAWKAIIL